MFGTASIPHRPTAKLVLAAVFLIAPAVMACTFGGEDAPIVKIPGVVIPALIFWVWWCFYAMFRLLGLQSLIGPIFLIMGLVTASEWLVACVIMMISAIRDVPFQRSHLELSSLMALWPLAMGYLLAIDQDVTEYRRQFRHHFSAISRLNPHVDNLPDDPINPS